MNHNKNSSDRPDSLSYHKNLNKKIKIKEKLLSNELEAEEIDPLLKKMDDYCDNVHETLEKINVKWKTEIFKLKREKKKVVTWIEDP